jgi:hypothetical protein
MDEFLEQDGQTLEDICQALVFGEAPQRFATKAAKSNRMASARTAAPRFGGQQE